MKKLIVKSIKRLELPKVISLFEITGGPNQKIKEQIVPVKYNNIESQIIPTWTFDFDLNGKNEINYFQIFKYAREDNNLKELENNFWKDVGRAMVFGGKEIMVGKNFDSYCSSGGCMEFGMKFIDGKFVDKNKVIYCPIINYTSTVFIDNKQSYKIDCPSLVEYDNGIWECIGKIGFSFYNQEN